ncbi:MAG: PAS domain-containing protein [Pseudomonadota bacterium]
MFETPVDVDRLTKPEADAFRYIAHVLGASFAGDQAATVHPDSANPHNDSASETADIQPFAPLSNSQFSSAEPRTASGPRPPVPRLKAGSTDSTTLGDPALIRALDAIPMPLLVADGDAVLFLNRTALQKFGHSCADVINASGGLGVLFDRRNRRRGALVPMLTAHGERMLAKVTLGAVSWANRCAVLITVDDQAAALDSAEAAARMFRSEGVTAAAMGAALEVCPHPAAIVTAEGDALAANKAFTALEDSLSTDAISPLISRPTMRKLTQKALASVDGSVECADRVLVGAHAYQARAIALGPLPACAIAMVPMSAAPLTGDDHVARQQPIPAPPASNGALPLSRSVADVVRRVRSIATDLAVLFVGDNDSGTADVSASVADAVERLVQILVRQDRPRSVITIRQDGGALRVTGGRALAVPLEESAAQFLKQAGEVPAFRVVRHGAGDLSIAPAEEHS